jgi:hypothetical protein
MAMAQLDVALKEAMNITGAIGVALVDYDSGMMLGSAGGGTELDLEIAAAGNTEVVRAKMNTMQQLGLKEKIEDILITLGSQYHLIRLVDESKGSGLFFYLALSKAQSNLAMARRQLGEIESQLSL